MAPVIQALYKNSFFKLTILATAQHRELLDEALDVFNIKPDVDLNIMSQNQSLGDLTGRLLINLNQTLKELREVRLRGAEPYTVLVNIAKGHLLENEALKRCTTGASPWILSAWLIQHNTGINA